MATVLTPPEQGLASRASPMYRFSVRQYHRMIETGVLTEDDRVELLEGWIIAKMTHNPPHDCAVELLQTELLARRPPEWVVRVQSAITTSRSEPEPDLVIARGPGRRYARTHPGPRDIALVVEVAESSLDQDRVDKARIYAHARIPVYWVVNLVDRQVEMYSQPRAGKVPAYRTRRDYRGDDSIPLAVGGEVLQPVPVQDVLP